ncbi:probable glutamine--tRNA ligase [Ischnura elegans]|uniref:probable glutamine--tRNA ligase n=1 Tax=Ischnura elegans TaxID=197161 RepID=UPI001ED8B3DB|nr:probable glutamine--tRNA ligase [Ischnura elegans]
MSEVDTMKMFQEIGLSEQKAKETLKNAAVTKNLTEIILEAKRYNDFPSANQLLLYYLATKIKNQILPHIPLIVEYLASGGLNTNERVDAALDYLLSHSSGKIDRKKLEDACGVGVVISADQIEEEVSKVISQHKQELIEKRYRFNIGILMQQVRTQLKWGDGKAIKNEVELQVLDLLGPKTDADLFPVGKPGKKSKVENVPKKKEAENKTSLPVGGEVASATAAYLPIGEQIKSKGIFHKPGENFKTEGYVITSNTSKLLADHLKATGGKVVTRFPPEPNGILHIGHAKAININFGYALATGGKCYLRYDDTNPEKEEEKFYMGIIDMVQWLGFKPDDVTHSSDYFDQLYEWAVALIKKNLAYVCHQKQEEIKGFDPPPSPWRERPVEESLILFEDMRNGKLDEGEATLRLKLTLEEGKQDPVAYRIKFIRHHRSGNKWCIYPTYDYTHCLCDSIENITHSLCTKEFQSRRSSYYWLCNALDIYCPVQWEYGRLNMNYTVVSKRKIAELITKGIVKDWDDPRLFTLSGLRRRGIPAQAINKLCALMGVTGAQAVVEPHMLDAVARDVLNVTAPRTMVVLDPLKVTIENFQSSIPTSLEVADFPGDPSKGHHKVTLKKEIYIERNDFREMEEKGFRRLTMSQSVGLRYANLVISFSDIVKDNSGMVSELKVLCKPIDEAEKPKAFIHWVSDPIPVEVRLYENLFLHKNPEDSTEVPGGFLSDCNRNSLSVVRAFADQSIKHSKVYDSYQFERIGYFTVDVDSQASKLVFNRSVTLKEDSNKI